MPLKLSSPTKLYLYSWTLDDVMFSLRVRNCPSTMRWFRQDDPLTLTQQKAFIENDIKFGGYNGMVIKADDEKVGLCGVKNTKEFTIAVLPEHQHRGISTWAMRQLIKQCPGIWSEVFVGNPALEWFIGKLGFKVTNVHERQYYKSGIGLIDTVEIIHE